MKALRVPDWSDPVVCGAVLSLPVRVLEQLGIDWRFRVPTDPVVYRNFSDVERDA